MIITKYKRDEYGRLKKVVLFRSIGSIFSLFDILIKVKKANIKTHCKGCIFENFVNCARYKDISGYCYKDGREDNQNVIFVPCGIFYKILYAVKSLIWRG